MKSIRISKELNRNPIQFEKELNLKMYKEIVLKINQAHNLEQEYKFSNQELREKLGLRNKEELLHFQRYFHSEGVDRKDVFILDEKFSIGGGVFSSKVYLDEGSIGFMVNPYWKKYFYSKLDIEKWHEVKGKTKEIRALPLEEPQKDKLLNMMTTVINHSIKGKYSQRLLDLLLQFKSSGIYFENWQKFRKVLEIPEKYRASDIDRQILNVAKKELLKANIKITKIDKIKKGRKIDRIEIFFKLESEPKFKQNQGVNNKVRKTNELIQGLKKNIFMDSEGSLIKYGETHIQEAMVKCSEAEGVDLQFLKNMGKKSETLLLNTLKKYL